jgi:hypothetical protein
MHDISYQHIPTSIYIPRYNRAEPTLLFLHYIAATWTQPTTTSRRRHSLPMKKGSLTTTKHHNPASTPSFRMPTKLSQAVLGDQDWEAYGAL